MTATTTELLQKSRRITTLPPPTAHERIPTHTRVIRDPLRGSALMLLLGLGAAALILSFGAPAGLQRPLLVSLAIFSLALAPRAAVDHKLTHQNGELS